MHIYTLYHQWENMHQPQLETNKTVSGLNSSHDHNTKTKTQPKKARNNREVGEVDRKSCPRVGCVMGHTAGDFESHHTCHR